MKVLAWYSLWVLVFVAQGCSENAAGAFSRCSADAECGPGESCVEGFCASSTLDVMGEVSTDSAQGDTTASGDTSDGGSVGLCPEGCGVGETCCSGRCVVLAFSATDCGACGRSCFAVLPGAVAASCLGGSCKLDACESALADCDGDSSNGCETDITVQGNCGGCGVVCGEGEVCSQGQCQCGDTVGSATAACGAGEVCCAEQCVAPSAPECTCGTCATGETCCAGVCTDTSSSAEHCGACGVGCGALAECRSGACACLSGQLGDVNNCGVCGRSCGTGQRCDAGNCVCQSGALGDDANCGACGQACASGERCEQNLCVCATGVLGDDANCGACGQACPSGSRCIEDPGSGAYVCEDCPSGLVRCDGACVDVTRDLAHCGGCGQVCAAGSGASSAVCAGGACEQSCNGNRADCDGDPGNGCERRLDDENSCGVDCGTAIDCGGIGEECRSGPPRHCQCDWTGPHCNPGERCDPRILEDICACGDGAACGSGQYCCPDGAGKRLCVDPNTDASHCGGCDRACLSGQSCVLGVCQ